MISVEERVISAFAGGETRAELRGIDLRSTQAEAALQGCLGTGADGNTHPYSYILAVDIAECKLGDRGTSLVAELMRHNPHVKSLSLVLNGAGLASANKLADMLRENSIIRTLNLRGNTITATGVMRLTSSLEANQTLLTLDVSGNKLGVEGARAIAQLLRSSRSLLSLNVSSNHLSGVESMKGWARHDVAGIQMISESLGANFTLTTLNLRANSCGADGAQLIAEALKVNSSLLNLDISNNAIGVAGAGYISEGLRHNSALLTLQMEWNGISEVGCQQVVDGVAENHTLVCLELGDNDIGVEGGAELQRLLTSNTTLTSLNMANNHITSDGRDNRAVQAIATALQAEHNLINLNLSGNAIGVLGVLSITQALMQNRSVTSLDLSWNEIRGEGPRHVAAMLQTNKVLASLNLQWTLIDDNETGFIAEALRTNDVLVALDLGCTPIGDEGTAQIAEAIRQNTRLKLQSLRGVALRDHTDVMHLPVEFSTENRRNSEVLAYIRAQATQGTQLVKRVKLMLVGQGGGGKTTLCERLCSSTFDSSIRMTDGVLMRVWKPDDIEFRIWDFAGQQVYSNTHPLFFSTRTVFVVVLNPRVDASLAQLEYYLQTIQDCAPDAPILLVSTHSDEVDAISRTVLQQLMDQHPSIRSYHHVSAKSGENIPSLIHELTETALSEPYVVQEVPRLYHEFELQLTALSESAMFSLQYERAIQIGIECGLQREQAVLAIDLFHHWGIIHRLPFDRLVLRPQDLADVMACVITADTSQLRKGYAEGGVLYHKDIDLVWADYAPELRPEFLELLHKNGLAYPLRTNEGQLPASLVPCMLLEQPPVPNVLTLLPADATPTPEVRVLFDRVLPTDLTPRLQVRLRSMATMGGAWLHGCVLQLQQSTVGYALIEVKHSERSISFRGAGAVSALKTSLLALVVLLEERFPGLGRGEATLVCICGKCSWPDHILQEKLEDGDMSVKCRKCKRVVPLDCILGFIHLQAKLESPTAGRPPVAPKHNRSHSRAPSLVMSLASRLGERFRFPASSSASLQSVENTTTVQSPRTPRTIECLVRVHQELHRAPIDSFMLSVALLRAVPEIMRSTGLDLRTLWAYCADDAPTPNVACVPLSLNQAGSWHPIPSGVIPLHPGANLGDVTPYADALVLAALERLEVPVPNGYSRWLRLASNRTQAELITRLTELQGSLFVCTDDPRVNQKVWLAQTDVISTAMPFALDPNSILASISAGITPYLQRILSLQQTQAAVTQQHYTQLQGQMASVQAMAASGMYMK